MNYKLHTLPNGLRVLSIPMPGLESVTTTIWVKTGSRFEDKNINGISHFLEHMVFKGSKKRPTAKEISELVDSFGGEFNAGTSKDWTNFYIKSRVANLDIAMDILADMVLNPILDEKEIEREKGTIIQEIAMYNDTPMMKIGDVYENLAYSGDPLGWDIAGTEKTVRNIKRNDFLRYRDMHYHPDKMLLSVAGGVTEKQVISLAKKYFESLGRSKTGKKSEGSAIEISQTKPGLLLQTKKSEQANLILGFLGEGRGYKKRFAQSILSAILGGGMSSRLFIEVRERRGLAYSVRTSIDRYQDVGSIANYAGVNLDKIEEAIKVILDQTYGLASGKYPITEKEFKKAKEFLKGHLALALEDTNDVNTFFAEQELFTPSDVLSPDEIYKRIDKVTIADVMNEAKKLFVPNRLNLAIIGPYKDEEKFIKLLK